jgi:2-phosphosulfolactate phosphatase
MILNAPSVVIDCFPSSAALYQDAYAIVAVDVIRATTLAVSAVATGRRCLVAASLEDAVALRDRLGDALLAGELGGNMPHGFDMNNSPADLMERGDIDRPLVMLSSSGTDLMLAAGRSRHGAYAACFRNLTAVARHLVGRHRRVALIGAGSRAEFREEDQMGCSWLAEALLAAGYRAENGATAELVERWHGVPAAAIEGGNSVGYLRRTGQLRDFEFTIGRIDDLELVCAIEDNEIRRIAGGYREPPRTAAGGR